MENRKNFVAGYAIGGTLFMVVLPVIFYFVSQAIDPNLPPLIKNHSDRIIPAIMLLILGLWFAFWSIIVQRKDGQGGPLEGSGVNVSPKTKKLNITGSYKYCRNPMLFGTCVYYFSLALFFDSSAFFYLALVFTLIMSIFVKKTEEKRLLADFGEEYVIYRSKTSFLVPFFAKDKFSRRYLGYLGFLGFLGIPEVLTQDWLGSLWLLWFLWFMYFFLPNKNDQNLK